MSAPHRLAASIAAGPGPRGVHRTQDGDRAGGDCPDARARPIHVVDEVERVGRPDQPEDGEYRVNRERAGPAEANPAPHAPPTPRQSAMSAWSPAAAGRHRRSARRRTSPALLRQRPPLRANQAAEATAATVVATHTAIPPRRAVGRRCQRSPVGRAMKPYRRARALTRGVATKRNGERDRAAGGSGTSCSESLADGQARTRRRRAAGPCRRRPSSRRGPGNRPIGSQPSTRLAFEASPIRWSTSAGRRNCGSTRTCFCQSRPTRPNAISTRSRTECAMPVATT